jgi:hypothetical protein
VNEGVEGEAGRSAGYGPRALASLGGLTDLVNSGSWTRLHAKHWFVPQEIGVEYASPSFAADLRAPGAPD